MDNRVNLDKSSGKTLEFKTIFIFSYPGGDHPQPEGPRKGSADMQWPSTWGPRETVYWFYWLDIVFSLAPIIGAVI